MFVLAFQSDDLQFIFPAMASVRDWRYFPKEKRFMHVITISLSVEKIIKEYG